MVWAASSQVTNTFANSPWAETVTVARGVSDLGTFTGLFMHTQPDDPPVIHASRQATGATQVQQGDTLTVTGFSAYVCEGKRSDGAYVLTFELRPHVVT